MPKHSDLHDTVVLAASIKGLDGDGNKPRKPAKPVLKHGPIIHNRAGTGGKRGTMGKSAERFASRVLEALPTRTPQADHKIGQRVAEEQIAGLVANGKRIEMRLTKALKAGEYERAAKLSTLLARTIDDINRLVAKAEGTGRTVGGKIVRKTEKDVPLRPIIKWAKGEQNQLVAAFENKKNGTQ